MNTAMISFNKSSVLALAKNGKRFDGRKLDEYRGPIEIESSISTVNELLFGEDGLSSHPRNNTNINIRNLIYEFTQATCSISIKSGGNWS